MMKRILVFGSATLGVALLCACGSSTPAVVDLSLLSKGNDNTVSTGGYWWTYTDHNHVAQSADLDALRLPFHATVDQVTSQNVALTATQERLNARSGAKDYGLRSRCAAVVGRFESATLHS